MYNIPDAVFMLYQFAAEISNNIDVHTCNEVSVASLFQH